MSPVEGRFDTAPAYLIIGSTKYAAKIIGTYRSNGEDDEYEARRLAREQAGKESRERRYAARQAELAIIQAERKRLAAEERAAKEALSKEAQRVKRRLMEERIEAKKRKYHSLALLTEKRKRARLEVPSGYVTLDKIAGITGPGLIIALNKKQIKGFKIRSRWYINEVEANEHVASIKERKKANAIVCLEKARLVKYGNT